MGKAKIIAAGVATYITAVGISYYYANSQKSSSREACKHQPKQRNTATNTIERDNKDVILDDVSRQSTYAKLASKYDSEIGKDEIVMGLSLIRWWNIRQAKGKVLEIGCGTGRNFSYYNMRQIDELVAVDSVAEMVEVSRSKIPSAHSEKVSLMTMNAHDLQFADDSFDFIVDTFGLCSYENPKQVIAELQRVLNKANPEARILFIEHGRAKYDWLNRILDSNAQHHANHWGCIWNLDIEQTIRQAGLEILSANRFHFGTTYVIEAKSGGREKEE